MLDFFIFDIINLVYIMSENSSKFPKFFIYMFSALILVMIVCAFFSLTAVGAVYFVMLLVVVVFTILDKRYNFFITNYKPIFIMFDLAGLVSVLTIICYEYSRHSLTLNIFLWMILAIRLSLVLVDTFFIKNKLITKFECLAIDFIQIGSMICVLTYFYHVSTFWYSVVAFALAVVNMALKIYVAIVLRKRCAKQQGVQIAETDEMVNSLEKSDDEGDVE